MVALGDNTGVLILHGLFDDEFVPMHRDTVQIVERIVVAAQGDEAGLRAHQDAHFFGYDETVCPGEGDALEEVLETI